jgi:hypothetical protein
VFRPCVMSVLFVRCLNNIGTYFSSPRNHSTDIIYFLGSVLRLTWCRGLGVSLAVVWGCHLPHTPEVVRPLGVRLPSPRFGRSLGLCRFWAFALPFVFPFGRAPCLDGLTLLPRSLRFSCLCAVIRVVLGTSLS